MQTAAAVGEGCALWSHGPADFPSNKRARNSAAATHFVRKQPARPITLSRSREPASRTDRLRVEAQRRASQASGVTETSRRPGRITAEEQDTEDNSDYETDTESDSENDSENDSDNEKDNRLLRDRYGKQEDDVTKAEIKRRARVLRKADLIREMARSGPRIEQVIQANEHLIDDEFLGLLKGRADMAEGLGEKGAEGLMVMWRHLKKLREHEEAAPASALLNDCLNAMDPERKLPLAICRQETREMMVKAFGLPVQTGPVDIFGIAASLGEDPDFEPEDTMKQFKAAVTKEAFLKETEGVLSDAIRMQRELEGAYASKSVSFKKEELAVVVKERRKAITILREVIALANKPIQ